MLSLYVHVPFCVRKCHYCGFFSTVYAPARADEYLDGLRFEASGYRQAFELKRFDSVYIGGGTPTVLSFEQVQRLTSVIKEHFLFSTNVEWSIEANPNTVSLPLLTFLRENGVTRLSLGIQSFDDVLLKLLGRLHSSEDAIESFRIARSAGFGNIGIDLIYGIPGLAGEEWSDALDKAISLKPEHISVYALSLDEGSRFTREAEVSGFSLPGDDTVAAQYEQAVVKLRAAGYERYEISNFSLPGFACRHNRNYWDRGEYLGLGPGAWSFLSGTRYRNIEEVREYAGRVATGRYATVDHETVDLRQGANEAIMLGLRTAEGMDLGRYEQGFGNDALRNLLKSAAPLERAGLLARAEGRLVLTEKGFLLADEALARLFA